MKKLPQQQVDNTTSLGLIGKERVSERFRGFSVEDVGGDFEGGGGHILDEVEWIIAVFVFFCFNLLFLGLVLIILTHTLMHECLTNLVL